MKIKQYPRKTKILSLIFILVVFIYIIRLFSLQIIEDKYKKGAASNAFLNKTIYPPRGLIYDRNDSLLVYNKPAYDITFINREIQNLDTNDLCRALNISRKDFDKKMKDIKNRRKNPGYSSLTPQVFMTQLAVEDIAIVQQGLYKYQGFGVQTRTLREYKYAVAGHLLGSIGEVSSSTIDKDNYYTQGDYAGRDGIEYSYEKALRGEKGVEILLRDARGRIKGKYADGTKDQLPKAGTDLKITIDIQLQALGERLLTGKIGSIVAIEPSTGEILAMVSNPTFDPALLVGRKRSKNYVKLLNDPTKPLYNRATQATYSPASTFKPFQAAVALQLGAITPNSHFICNGPSSQPIRCTHYHGSSISIYNAIEQSCNPYFWQAFRLAIEKNGYGEGHKDFKKTYNEWRGMMLRMGFGEKFTDTDIYQQSAGKIPKTTYFDKYFGKTGWRAATIRSLSIGQGEILVTPLQLANATCVIANKGYYITPHLNKADTMLNHRHESGIDSQHFDVVDQGMWRVNEYGTGRHYKIPNVVSCGKTGTAQNSRGKDHSLFIGYAPRENPKIAIAVVVENAGFGTTWASPAAMMMMEKYLNDTIQNKELLESYVHKTTNPYVKKH